MTVGIGVGVGVGVSVGVGVGVFVGVGVSVGVVVSVGCCLGGLEDIFAERTISSFGIGLSKGGGAASCQSIGTNKAGRLERIVRDIVTTSLIIAPILAYF